MYIPRSGLVSNTTVSAISILRYIIAKDENPVKIVPALSSLQQKTTTLCCTLHSIALRHSISPDLLCIIYRIPWDWQDIY